MALRAPPPSGAEKLSSGRVGDVLSRVEPPRPTQVRVKRASAAVLQVVEKAGFLCQNFLDLSIRTIWIWFQEESLEYVPHFTMESTQHTQVGRALALL